MFPTRNIIAAFLAASVALLPASGEPQTFKRHRDHVLGTSFDLAVQAETKDAADLAEAAILEEINRLSDILNTYDPDSEISRLNRAGQASVSPELIEVLETCDSLREETSNALSCRIGKLIDAWNTAERNGTLPSRPDLRLMAGQTRRAVIAIDAAAGSVTRPDSVVFRTDALAKGYIIDKALQAGKQASGDVSGILLNIGGDLRAWGAGPHDGAWHAGISSDSSGAADGKSGGEILSFVDGALATSGAGPRDRVIDGQHFGHIISPSDGWPVIGILGASVFARDTRTADALATAFMVMEISEALSMTESLDGVETSILAEDGRRYESSGWKALVSSSADGESHAASGWAEGQELVIQMEIPDLDVPKYERPYVAVWIADPDRNLVRILMLAGDESRWMEENYYWFRRFGRKAGSLVDALSGPTRRPGEYIFKWDGLDHDGSPVEPGNYILHVEAAREHGGHQHESIDLKLDGSLISLSVPAGSELGTVSVRFGEQG